MPEAAAEAALEEAAYYQAIEEFFVSRRGDPLFLSNADWLLIRKWRRSGLPLRIALRGIADALDGHAHSWGRKRKVGSLAYCAAEVDAARERWQRALSFDDEAETSVSVALTSFADALEAATGLGGRGGAAARSAAAEVRAWTVPAAGGPPRLEQLTRRLGATEKALLEALRADAEPTTLATILREIEADLAPYRGRMPERVLDQIRDEAWARRLLARHGIPRLSLFHL
ncbi:MAG TPA: hypothetical protein VFT38_00730 [Vicinamibacteria bacterium]|nr:hypothetical protein [Vicinamibacteria bacterium]